jgi:hypothetical protein
MKKSKRMKRAANKLNAAFAAVAFSKSGQNANGKKHGMRGPKTMPGTFGPASHVRKVEITDAMRAKYQTT